MTFDPRQGSGSLPIILEDDLPVIEEFATTDTPPGGVLEREIRLAELLDMKAFREVCASFVDLYKIGIKIFDRDGTKLVDIRVGNGDWCGYIFAHPTGRHECTGLVTKIKQFNYPGLEQGEVVEQHCFSGLKYVIMPITYGGDLLGRVIYGPFLPEICGPRAKRSPSGPTSIPNGSGVTATRSGEPRTRWSSRSSPTSGGWSTPSPSWR